MKLEDVTPLILTWNEEPNLLQTLQSVSWAKQIVIIDSGSTDKTLEIAKQFPQVAVFYRQFDHFADQCNFGLSKISTPWTLSLDADYKCPPVLADELATIEPSNSSGFRASFIYCVFGRPLRASLYPPRVVLYQTQKASYQRDGHAHRVTVDGEIGSLRSRILHDDHKSLVGWYGSQLKYAQLETEKLTKGNAQLGWKDRIRKKVVLAPFLVLVYLLVGRGLILNGRAGLHYTMQRVLAELLLSLTLLDSKLRKQLP